MLDVETTTKNKGNPFTYGNKLVSVCIRTINEEDRSDITRFWIIEYDLEPYSDKLRDIESIIGESNLLVGFNIKFDLHWLRKYIPNIVFKTIWDCQLAEFILSNQRKPYPSLADTSSNLGLGKKIDTIKEEYWDKGLDTTDVPLALLQEYNINDVNLTYELYQIQQSQLSNKRKLFELQCEDLKVLAEMEFNGLMLNVNKMNAKALELEEEKERLIKELNSIVGVDFINWNSPQHLSVVLYGGYISVPCMETVTRVLKSGKVKTYERQSTVNRIFDPRVQPIPGTEGSTSKILSREGLSETNRRREEGGRSLLQRYYSVDEKTLRQIRGSREIIRICKLNIELSRVDKLLGTYYRGLVKLHEQYQWNKYQVGEISTIQIHGSFNQCVAVTGRLSSSSPNLQNLAGDIKECIVSRYQC
ncbi:MAG: DNA polymerase [Nitrosotalea sp.]